MFISFLFPYRIRNQEAPFLWVFYKQISSFSPEQLILIGSKDYFMDPSYFKEQKRLEVEDEYGRYNEYTIPTKKLIESYESYIIDDNVFDELEGLFHKSSNLVWSYLLKNRNKRFEVEIERVIKQCLVDDRSVSAIITWCNVPSLKYVAEKYGLKVIHNEIGPLRKPHYFNTAYFDLSGVNGNTECFNRYQDFKNEITCKVSDFSVLSKKELLTLFSQTCDEGELEGKTFDVGVVLQVEDDSNMLAFANGLNNFLLINIVNKFYNSQSVLIRKHPSGHFDYKGCMGEIDKSSSSRAFLKKCNKICTINSSVGLESVLHGKETYILGDCAFKFLASNDFAENGKNINNLDINYVLFGYLIPYEFLFKYEYYQWRLSVKSEVEVYKFHMEYYIKKKIDELNEKICEKDRKIDELTLQVSEVDSTLKKINEEKCKVDIAIIDLQKDINSIIQSKSWRLTKPLRVIASIAKNGIANSFKKYIFHNEK